MAKLCETRSLSRRAGGLDVYLRLERGESSERERERERTTASLSNFCPYTGRAWPTCVLCSDSKGVGDCSVYPCPMSKHGVCVRRLLVYLLFPLDAALGSFSRPSVRPSFCPTSGGTRAIRSSDRPTARPLHRRYATEARELNIKCKQRSRRYTYDSLEFRLCTCSSRVNTYN